MLRPEDLVIIKYDKNREITADYFARHRLIFEYPRGGYGKYNEGHLVNIRNGLLGEFAFLEFICDIIKEKYKDANIKWKVVKEDLGFCYTVIIRMYDEGYEFKFKNVKVDVKTYGTKQVSIEQIFFGLEKKGEPLNLFIDKEQYIKAEIYVQAFILGNNDIALAGYNIGLPPLANWMPKPAYCKPIPELLNMMGLTENITKIIS